MSAVNRYIVTGINVESSNNQIPARKAFKRLAAAKRLADDLLESKVYDLENKQYVYGSAFKKA